MRVNIEAERARHGYTKGQLCEKLNITGKTYNSYIRGGNIPSTKLLKMHELFNCSVDYLLATDCHALGVTPNELFAAEGEEV